MKKLLSFLGAISFSTVLATEVTACGEFPSLPGNDQSPEVTTEDNGNGAIENPKEEDTTINENTENNDDSEYTNDNQNEESKNPGDGIGTDADGKKYKTMLKFREGQEPLDWVSIKDPNTLVLKYVSRVMSEEEFNRDYWISNPKTPKEEGLFYLQSSLREKMEVKFYGNESTVALSISANGEFTIYSSVKRGDKIVLEKTPIAFRSSLVS